MKKGNAIVSISGMFTKKHKTKHPQLVCCRSFSAGKANMYCDVYCHMPDQSYQKPFLSL